MVIWKDVQGLLNADPKEFENTVKLDKISYKEAIESGASVIHPKTLKPLQNKCIPLKIKSFIDPSLEGTVIQKMKTRMEYTLATYTIQINFIIHQSKRFLIYFRRPH